VVAAQPAIKAKEHTLRVESPSTPIQLEVDPVRMTQVITNLLTNATKYTPRGGLIYIGARLDSKHVTIYVRDNGIGLKAEAISKVFEMFTRVEPEVGRSEGGLGIGLALAKGIAELHGGRIEAHSAGPNQGSEFVICLPRSLMVSVAAPVPVRGRDTTNSTSPRRILIADDNRDSAETMSMLLTISGHEVHIAHSGAAALEMAKRIRPDIGVLDIGMPDLTGYEVAERIRHEAWGKDITLVAVTGWGQDADKRRALAAGFDHHLTKPIDPERFKQLFDA
jgi:CheY-like chemotaxis protein